jgi:hypothetical protein
MSFFVFAIIVIGLVFMLRPLRMKNWYLGIWMPTVLFFIFSIVLAVYLWIARTPYEHWGMGMDGGRFLYEIGILFIPCGLLISFLCSPPARQNWRHPAGIRLFVFSIPISIAISILHCLLACRFIER